MYKLILIRTVVFLLVVFSGATTASERLRVIHDAHIHYNQDLWQTLPPEQALQLLREQSISCTGFRHTNRRCGKTLACRSLSGHSHVAPVSQSATSVFLV